MTYQFSVEPVVNIKANAQPTDQPRKFKAAYAAGGLFESYWARVGTMLSPRLAGDGIDVSGDAAFKDQLYVFDDGVELNSGQRVDTIEATLTNNPTGLATSSAIYSFVSSWSPAWLLWNSGTVNEPFVKLDRFISGVNTTDYDQWVFHADPNDSFAARVVLQGGNFEDNVPRVVWDNVANGIGGYYHQAVMGFNPASFFPVTADSDGNSFTFRDGAVLAPGVFVFNIPQGNGFAWARAGDGIMELYSSGLKIQQGLFVNAGETTNSLRVYKYSATPGTPELALVHNAFLDQFEFSSSVILGGAADKTLLSLTPTGAADLAVANVGWTKSVRVARKTGAYTTTSADELLELEGNFELTLHAPADNRKLTLVNISGQQTLTTVVGLAYLLSGDSVEIYYNGTEWRVKS